MSYRITDQAAISFGNSMLMAEVNRNIFTRVYFSHKAEICSAFFSKYHRNIYFNLDIFSSIHWLHMIFRYLQSFDGFDILDASSVTAGDKKDRRAQYKY